MDKDTEDDMYDDDLEDVDDYEGEYTSEDIAEFEAQVGLTGVNDHLDLQQRLELLSKYNVKLTKPRAQRKASIGGKWTAEEDEELRLVVSQQGPKNWKKVAELLGDTRTDVQCLHRWNKVLKPGLHKGPGLEYEDAIVRDTVLKYGVGNVKWSSIAMDLPGRIGRRRRLVYLYIIIYMYVMYICMRSMKVVNIYVYVDLICIFTNIIYYK